MNKSISIKFNKINNLYNLLYKDLISNTRDLINSFRPRIFFNLYFKFKKLKSLFEHETI